MLLTLSICVLGALAFPASTMLAITDKASTQHPDVHVLTHALPASNVLAITEKAANVHVLTHADLVKQIKSLFAPKKKQWFPELTTNFGFMEQIDSPAIKANQRLLDQEFAKSWELHGGIANAIKIALAAVLVSFGLQTVSSMDEDWKIKEKHRLELKKVSDLEEKGDELSKQDKIDAFTTRQSHNLVEGENIMNATTNSNQIN